jgi:hypothetical protein
VAIAHNIPELGECHQPQDQHAGRLLRPLRSLPLTKSDHEIYCARGFHLVSTQTIRSTHIGKGQKAETDAVVIEEALLVNTRQKEIHQMTMN